MARLNFVKKARKADKRAGIKAGDAYYWWQFRYGPKHKSKTRPRRSQLTQSEYYGTIWEIEDELLEAARTRDPVEIASVAESLRDRVEELQNEIQDKMDSLEQAFPNGCPTSELLQERFDACEQAVQDLDTIKDAAESYDGTVEDEAEREAELETAISEAEWFSFSA